MARQSRPRALAETLQPIAALPAKFAQAKGHRSRGEIMDEARRRLQDLGTARETSDRFLYSATNPIGEECFRECHFSIGENLINEVTIEAEPWIDLWRDNYAFVASRVAAGLRDLFEKAPRQNGAMPFPAFLRHCATLKMPLTGPGMVALAHLAFQEVKAAFRERMRDRPDAEEWELTADDCHFIRQNFQYEKFDEFTYPSADLQLEARSVEASDAVSIDGFWRSFIRRWRCFTTVFTGVVRTRHPRKCAGPNHQRQPQFSLWVFRRGFHRGHSGADLDAMPERTNFVAPQRGDPQWRIIPPAEIEVYVEDKNGDVCLRTRGSREYLGSFARAWVIPLGFHPFHFGRAPHMPRLRCGRVIVQRRSWTVTLEELGPGNLPASHAIWFSRSSDSARKRDGPAMFIFARANRPCVAVARKAVIRIPSRSLSISKAISFSKSSIAG